MAKAKMTKADKDAARTKMQAELAALEATPELKSRGDELAAEYEAAPHEFAVDLALRVEALEKGGK